MASCPRPLYRNGVGNPPRITASTFSAQARAEQRPLVVIQGHTVHNRAPHSVPDGFTLENWRFLWQRPSPYYPDLWRTTWNTLRLAVGMTLTMVAISTPTGYVLSRMKFPGRNALLSSTLILHAFPAITLLIAVYYVLRVLGLLNSISGVDYLEPDPKKVAKAGFEPHGEVVYHFQSITHNHRFVLKLILPRWKDDKPGELPEVPSVTSLWGGADWHERETFDLFGVIFDGHPDLRRILLPDDWQGHALRKDFPLRGYEPYSLK